MAENSWPFENADTTEVQFAKWASVLAESGAVTGLDVTVSSGLTVNVGSGTGIVRGMFYENTSAKALTVGTAPAAGQTRLDAIVLRLDMAANTVTAVVKAGTANSGTGVAPTLTQTDATWEVYLRKISVPGGAASLVAGNINPVEPPTGMRVIPFVGAPPALTGTARALGLNLATLELSYWNGSAWSAIAAGSVPWGSITGEPTVFPSNDANFTGPLSVGKGGTGATSLTGLTVGNADKVGSKKINVQAGTPSSPTTNDLWFW